MTRYAMSRRRRDVIFAVCVLAAAFLVALDHGCPSLQKSQPTAKTALAAQDDVTKYDAKTFIVVKVIDGDTLDIDVPDLSASGGQNYAHTRIRLWGVDTPETKDPRRPAMYFGKEASEFAARLALGKEVGVFLDKDRDTRDKYRRLLAYMQLPDKRFLNEVLLSEGYAYADSRFRHNFYNKYRQLESVARSQKKGLWRGVTEEQMPKWRQRQRSVAAEVNDDSKTD